MTESSTFGAPEKCINPCTLSTTTILCEPFTLLSMPREGLLANESWNGTSQFPDSYHSVVTGCDQKVGVRISATKPSLSILKTAITTIIRQHYLSSSISSLSTVSYLRAIYWYCTANQHGVGRKKDGDNDGQQDDRSALLSSTIKNS
jgi:hypothetical protein